MAFKRSKNEVATVRSDFQHDPNPWELRDKRIGDMVDSYMQNFYYSDTWQTAIRENWDMSLMRFARTVARIQASLINDPARDFGWDGFNIFGAKMPDESVINNFMGRCRAQARMGIIDVPIPVDAINRWKAALA